MTNIDVYKQNNNIKITVSGHSGYAERGADIVCAAISSHIMTLVNALEQFEQAQKCLLDYDFFDESGTARIEVRRIKGDVKTVCEVICAGLELIAINYPNNVSYKSQGWD